MFRRCIPSVLAAASCLAWWWLASGLAVHKKPWFDVYSPAAFWVGVLLTLVALLTATSLLSRRALHVSILGVLLFAATLILLEIAGQIGVVSYPKIFGTDPRELLGASQESSLDIRGITYPDIAFDFMSDPPGVPFHFVTDRRGFRNGRDAHDADIYLLGDSFLVAGLLPIDATSAQELERRSGRRVMNIALVDLCVQEERDLFLKQDLPLSGRLVVHFVFEGNDLKGSARYRSGSRRSVEAAPEFPETTLLHHVLERIRRASCVRNREMERRSGFLRGERILFRWLGRDMLPYSSEIPYALEAISELQKHVLSAGGRYSVVFIPSKLRVMGDLCTISEDSRLSNPATQLPRLPEELKRHCGEKSIPFIDLTMALRSETLQGRLPYGALDSHWSEHGHRVAAEVIAETLNH